MKVILYSDGSSRGNPGPGGFGTVLHFTDSNGKLHTRELSQGYTCTTNNRMELLGVITGLEALKRPCTVEVHSDSQYVVNAFNQHWVEGWLKRGWKNSKKEPVKNSDLWKRLLEETPQRQLPLGERPRRPPRKRALRRAGNLGSRWPWQNRGQRLFGKIGTSSLLHKKKAPYWVPSYVCWEIEIETYSYLLFKLAALPPNLAQRHKRTN